VYQSKYPADKTRTLTAAKQLTDAAVDEIYPALPDVWHAAGVDPMDARARDQIVQCTLTKEQQAFVPRSAVAPLLMRAVPALWILDSRSDALALTWLHFRSLLFTYAHNGP